MSERGASEFTDHVPGLSHHPAVRVQVASTICPPTTGIARKGGENTEGRPWFHLHPCLLPSLVEGETAEGQAKVQVPTSRRDEATSEPEVLADRPLSLGAGGGVQEFGESPPHRGLGLERGPGSLITSDSETPVYPAPASASLGGPRKALQIDGHSPVPIPFSVIIQEGPGRVGTVSGRVEGAVKAIEPIDPLPFTQLGELETITKLNREGGTQQGHVEGPKITEGGVWA